MVVHPHLFKNFVNTHSFLISTPTSNEHTHFQWTHLLQMNTRTSFEENLPPHLLQIFIFSKHPKCDCVFLLVGGRSGCGCGDCDFQWLIFSLGEHGEHQRLMMKKNWNPVVKAEFHTGHSRRVRMIRMK